MDDALGRPRGAGGVDDEGRVVGGGGGEVGRAGGRAAPAISAGPSTGRAGGGRQGEAGAEADQRRGEVGEDRGDLGRGELRRERHRDRAEGVGGEEEDGEVLGVAEAQRDAVAAADAAGGEAAGGGAHRGGDLGVGAAGGDVPGAARTSSAILSGGARARRRGCARPC